MEIRPADWPRVTVILEHALELDGAARSSYVETACAADLDLKNQVEAMLAAHDRAATFLETPIVTIEPAKPDLPELR